MDFAPRIGFFIMDSSGGLWVAVFILAERTVLMQTGCSHMLCMS
jgi:hypothetical protein